MDRNMRSTALFLATIWVAVPSSLSRGQMFDVVGKSSPTFNADSLPSIVHERAPLSSDVLDIASANNQFAIDLYCQIATGAQADENVLVSPLSISTALAMTYAGARGRTAQQMADVLHFELPDDRLHAAYGDLLGDLNTEREGYELNIVNRLFGQSGYPFKQPFLDTLANGYRAPLEQLDFLNHPEPSRTHINDWVAEQTNDLIQGLLPSGSVSPETRLVLTNAVYFNGAWKYKFDEGDTQDAPFYFADGGQTVSSMMRQTNSFRYGSFDGFQMLEMPYAGDDLSMVVMLPDEVGGLVELEGSLTSELLETSLASMSMRRVDVTLPKFTFDSKFKLKNTLDSLGMTDAFEGVADLSGIAGEGLSVSDVIHQTFIDVSEEGTEAAAATAVTLIATTALMQPPRTPVFRADHPFLFGLRDAHTGTLMFLGRVVETDSLTGASASAVPEPCSITMLLIGVGLVIGVRRRAPASVPAAGCDAA